MKTMINITATPLMPALKPVNSYSQIGQTLLFASTFMAQEGHSFVFMQKDYQILRGGRSNAFDSCAKLSLCEPSQKGLLFE